MVDNKKSQSGFALLVSLIVVGAVLSIGLVILDLSIKQVRLAATTKDSEIAFHAANAGMECARFWRRNQNQEMINGSTTDPINCFNTAVGAVAADAVTPDVTGDGRAYKYAYQIDWNSNQSCTVITTVVAVAELSGAGVTVDNMTDVDMIPGYPDGDTLSCGASSQCTVVSVQGYNRSCAQRASFGTIQREVLLEF